jgi:regulator of RNase E activity RraA
MTGKDESVLELQGRWDKIRIANLYDALDKMGFPNQCIDLSIRPLFPQQHLAGRAITVRGVRSPLSEAELKEHRKVVDFEDLQEFLYPGSVVVVDGGGERLTGKFGEMTSWFLKQGGAKGIVIDGYIRDYLGLAEIPDFTACTCGTSPVESSRRWKLQEFNTIIALPGTLTSQVRVTPGDWVIGGMDGVIIVPEEISMEALEIAEDIESREEGMRADLATGVPFKEAFRKWDRA